MENKEADIALAEFAKKASSEILKRFVGPERTTLHHFLVMAGLGTVEKYLLRVFKGIDFSKFNSETGPNDSELESLMYDNIQKIKFNPNYPYYPGVENIGQKLMRVMLKVCANMFQLDNDQSQLLIDKLKDVTTSMAFNEGEDPKEVQSIMGIDKLQSESIAHESRGIAQQLEDKSRLFNVMLVEETTHNLFKLKNDDVNVIATALNSNADVVNVAGLRIQVSKIKSVKIFQITDIKGVDNELYQEGKLDPAAKKFYGYGNWNYTKHLLYGIDVTGELLKPQLLYAETPILIAQSNIVDILSIIKAGEDKKTEFKSTLRWDLRNNKAEKRIEQSAMKAIAGFLNGVGGNLIIGVDDNGTILGLDNDFNSFKGQNKKDEFQKYFDTLIANGFGNRMHSAIKIEFKEVENKICALITVSARADEPVFLKEGGVEMFYIRRNTTTVELKGREMVDYIKIHWKN